MMTMIEESTRTKVRDGTPLPEWCAQAASAQASSSSEGQQHGGNSNRDPLQPGNGLSRKRKNGASAAAE